MNTQKYMRRSPAIDAIQVTAANIIEVGKKLEAKLYFSEKGYGLPSGFECEDEFDSSVLRVYIGDWMAQYNAITDRYTWLAYDEDEFSMYFEPLTEKGPKP